MYTQTCRCVIQQSWVTRSVSGVVYRSSSSSESRWCRPRLCRPSSCLSCAAASLSSCHNPNPVRSAWLQRLVMMMMMMMMMMIATNSLAAASRLQHTPSPWQRARHSWVIWPILVLISLANSLLVVFSHVVGLRPNSHKPTYSTIVYGLATLTREPS